MTACRGQQMERVLRPAEHHHRGIFCIVFFGRTLPGRRPPDSPLLNRPKPSESSLLPLFQNFYLPLIILCSFSLWFALQAMRHISLPLSLSLTLTVGAGVATVACPGETSKTTRRREGANERKRDGAAPSLPPLGIVGHDWETAAGESS